MIGIFVYNLWCKKILVVLVNMYRLKVLNFLFWDV